MFSILFLGMISGALLTKGCSIWNFGLLKNRRTTLGLQHELNALTYRANGIPKARYGRNRRIREHAYFRRNGDDNAKDEFVYHEMVAHVPLFTHPNPENVLVVGGGDGGVIREVLKHPSVKKRRLLKLTEKLSSIRKVFARNRWAIRRSTC